MRVLLTGANGHLGSNLARALLAHGYQVVAFTRPGADMRGLAGLALEHAKGDVLDRESLIAAAAGCQVIIHSAGIFRYWENDGADIVGTAIHGAQNVFAAAHAAGIERLIFTSSTYAIGSTSDMSEILTVDSWNDNAQTPYAIAKTEGEREAWRQSEKYGVPMVAICSAGHWGRYDYRITPAMRWIRGFVNGTIPVVDVGGGFVDVRDSAEAHVRAITLGQPGKRYVVSGANLHMRDIAAIIERLTGTRHISVNIGKGPALLAAGLLEMVAKISRRPPLTTRAFIREQLGRYQCADPSLANETFGFTPRNSEEMITDAIRWLLYLGAIHGRKAHRLAVHFPPDVEWGPRPERA